MDTSDQCYICLDAAHATNPIMEYSPCKCTGSIKIHWACFAYYRKQSARCGSCKTPFNMQVTDKNTLIINDDDQQIYYSLIGNIIGKGPISNGLKHGYWKIFYEAGTLKEEGSFIEGRPHGQWKAYYESGTIKVETIRVEGHATGPAKYYYESGQLKNEGNYVSNKQHGPWKDYYESGNLKFEGCYDTGTKCGAWKYFNESGDPVAE